MELPAKPARVVEQFIHAINQHHVDDLIALLSSDHVMIDPGDNALRGKELRKAWTAYFAMFPDYLIHVDHMLVEGDLVVVLGHAEGTYAKRGIPNESNHWRIPAAWRARVESGHISLWQVYADNDPVRKILEKHSSAPELIRDEIRYSKYVAVPPDRVYDAITTSEGLDGWFTRGAEVEARPGGNILFRWKDFGPGHVTGEDGGKVLEADRPRRFVFQWTPDQPTYSTTVELDLEPVPGGTIVRIRETGYQNTSQGLRAMLNCSAGWGEALTMLRYYLEHGITDHQNQEIDHP